MHFIHPAVQGGAHHLAKSRRAKGMAPGTPSPLAAFSSSHQQQQQQPCLRTLRAVVRVRAMDEAALAAQGRSSSTPFPSGQFGSFSFDAVHDESVGQHAFYSQSVAPVVADFLQVSRAVQQPSVFSYSGFLRWSGWRLHACCRGRAGWCCCTAPPGPARRTRSWCGTGSRRSNTSSKLA